ncbi:MAG TPA: sugar-binding transcriptional regulator [Fodinibius sp.]|nr:sugar-binding transcriptional regulator [Fodinibius sp.]
MAKTRTTNEEKRLLTKVSSLYYEHDCNQQLIADRLHLSRPKVSRLLKKARQIGIVQISVKKHQEYFLELENELEDKFNLKEAVIFKINAEATQDSVRNQIGAASAEYLYRTVGKGETIGVTWGTTLQAMADAMINNPIPDTHVIQALGGVGPPEAKAHATDISRRFSQLLESKLSLLPAPGIVGSAAAKEALLADRQVKNTLAFFSKIDTLFVGIGAMSTNPVLDKNSEEIAPKAHQELLQSEAVGDISLRFFNNDGEEVESEMKDLVIGISIKEIKAVDTVVGVASGKEKGAAIRGALNGQLIDVLITDSITAQEICSNN